MLFDVITRYEIPYRRCLALMTPLPLRATFPCSRALLSIAPWPTAAHTPVPTPWAPSTPQIFPHALFSLPSSLLSCSSPTRPRCQRPYHPRDVSSPSFALLKELRRHSFDTQTLCRAGGVISEPIFGGPFAPRPCRAVAQPPPPSPPAPLTGHADGSAAAPSVCPSVCLSVCLPVGPARSPAACCAVPSRAAPRSPPFSGGISRPGPAPPPPRRPPPRRPAPPGPQPSGAQRQGPKPRGDPKTSCPQPQGTQNPDPTARGGPEDPAPQPQEASKPGPTALGGPQSPSPTAEGDPKCQPHSPGRTPNPSPLF